MANASQGDADLDGIGDVCDSDDDNDSVADGRDRWASTPTGTPVLRNGCSAAQTCPTTARWKNHGAYVVCVGEAADDLYDLDRITRPQASSLVVDAARSNVGRNRRDRDYDHGRHGHDDDGGCRD